MNEKILFVDDDTNVLAAYKRNLRSDYNVVTAENGAKGISILKEQGPFAVVVSDFNMPQINGIQFLAMSRTIAPDTVRIMLTGQAQMQVAIDAVNNGNLFRFLTKPCPTTALMETLTAAVEQYHLIMSEHELLEKTLKGSIKVLIDIISIVSPVAFRQSSSIRDLAKKLANRLNEKNLWEIELAAMLSQIGCVTVPHEILEKKYQGEALTPGEDEMFNSHPQTGKKVLANIPRLEGIAEGISYQLKHFDGGGIPEKGKLGKDIPLSGRILKLILDFNEQTAKGKTEDQAIKIINEHRERYDPDIISVLEEEILEASSIAKGYVVRFISTKDIVVGMVLAEDMRDKTGALLLHKGHVFTDVLKTRLTNFGRLGTIVEPFKVLERPVEN